MCNKYYFVFRDPTSKWYLPPSFYPLNVFPSFLSGTGYVFTGSLVPVLYSCSLRFVTKSEQKYKGCHVSTILNKLAQFSFGTPVRNN